MTVEVTVVWHPYDEPALLQTTELGIETPNDLPFHDYGLMEQAMSEFSVKVDISHSPYVREMRFVFPFQG